jgi:hypothetical protein
MVSTKRLRSVLQFAAHHCMSERCDAHPLLGPTCAQAGLTSVSVDLLKPGFSPGISSVGKELRLSAKALRDTFSTLLKAERVERRAVARAHALFQFDDHRKPTSCYVSALTEDGKRFGVTVDALGKVTQANNA